MDDGFRLEMLLAYMKLLQREDTERIHYAQVLV
jgi:hypothetical protein